MSAPSHEQATASARLRRAAGSRRGPHPRAATAHGTAAVVFATAASLEGGSASTLAVEDTTVVGRLLAQLEVLGITRAWIITRPKWRDAVEAVVHDGALEATVIASASVSDDLRAVADIASASTGPLLIARGDAITQREALAGLLADPRIVSGVLVSSSPARGRWSFRTHSARGRLVSAASPYHRISHAGPFFLGLLKVDDRDRKALVSAAGRLAELVEDPSPRWRHELRRKAADWRAGLWRSQNDEVAPPSGDVAARASLPLDERSEAELARGVGVAAEDAVSLLLVGLVRSDVPIASRHLRGFYYGRPSSVRAVDDALEELERLDEDDVALDAAVKGSDGFFTTFFVSTWSRYAARFAARMGWTPNAISVVSMLIGIAAAGSFAIGSRPGMVIGALLAYFAFAADCVDGQLARYTRQFSKLGAWLDSVLDRAKEYVIFAGLALGSSRGFGEDVWLLAAAALTLQTARHALDFSYGAGQREVVAALPQMPLEHPEDVLVDGVPRSIAAPPATAAPATTASVPAAAGSRAAAVISSTAAPGAATARMGAADSSKPLRAPAEPSDGSGPIATPPAAASRTPADRSPRALMAEQGRRVLRVVTRLDRYRPTYWAKRMLVLPIGERFALIALTAAFTTPRVTFIALLAWGTVAASYAVLGRVLRTLAR